MRELLISLQKELSRICPSFVHVLPRTPYPYITVEAVQILEGLPWGPSVALIHIKIWSRYAGTREILKLAKGVDTLLNNYAMASSHFSVKVLDSSLSLLPDEKTRVHTFRLKSLLHKEQR